MDENVPETPPEGRRGRKWRRALVFGAVVVIVMGLLLWKPVEEATEAIRCSSCCGSLKFIALAMLNYEQNNGCFPPAYIADKNGRLMHSWRVLLMPYMSEAAFFERYRFDEPWNSPYNRALAQGVPKGMNPNYPMYHCPPDRDSDPWDTSYVMLVGPGMISNGPASKRLQNLPNGSSRTVMIIEMSESGIHWMEPRDLNVDEMTFKINDPNGKGIRSKHPGGAVIVSCDCAVRFIQETADPEVVKALITGKTDQRIERLFGF